MENTHRPFATVATAASFVSIGLAGIYWISRIGFANPVRPVLEVSALALFIINVPYVAKRFSSRRGWQTWASSYSLYWLATLGMAILAGQLAGSVGNGLNVIALLGIAAFVITCGDWLRAGRWWRSAVMIAGSLAFSTFAGGVVWGRIYKSPLFFEMMSVGSPVHHDPITLAAIGNVARTYGIPGPGLDGLPSMAYHWGTPLIFAQLADLLRTGTLDFYNFGYVVIFLPFLFGGILCFATEARVALSRSRGDTSVDADLRDNLRLVGVFLVAIIGVFPITGMDMLGVWTSNVMISESYAVAVGVGLLLAGMTVVFWHGGGREALRGTMRPLDWLFTALVLPTGIFVLGYLKVSLMVLAFIAIGYVSLRLRLYRRPAFIVIGILLIAGVYQVYGNVSLPEHREGMVPFDFLWGYVPPRWWQFFFLVHLFWSWLYIALRLRAEGAHTFAHLRSALRDRRVLDAEIVAVVALAGVGPGLLLHINGGSAFYFSDVQRWLSVSLLIAGAGILLPSLKPGRWMHGMRLLATVLVATPLLYSMLANSVYWTKRMLVANGETRTAAYHAGGATNTARSAVLGSLRSLGSLSLEERRRTALFIRQDESAYWNLLARPGACAFSGHVAPALTGMTMVDGMPPHGCALVPYYGLGLQEARVRPQVPADTLPAALCRRAAPYNIARVMTLHFDAEGRASTRIDECQTAQ